MRFATSRLHSNKADTSALVNARPTKAEPTVVQLLRNDASDIINGCFRSVSINVKRETDPESLIRSIAVYYAKWVYLIGLLSRLKIAYTVIGGFYWYNQGPGKGTKVSADVLYSSDWGLGRDGGLTMLSPRALAENLNVSNIRLIIM